MEAVIFDLDGLLADTEIISLKSLSRNCLEILEFLSQKKLILETTVDIGKRRMFNDFWIPMIYPGTLTKPWIKFMNWKLKS